MGIVCDRCGQVMDDWWEIAGMTGIGGNCTYCGDDLCAACAESWNEYGECQNCQIPANPRRLCE